jgi:hypothetical protein
MCPVIHPDFSESSGIQPGIYPAKIRACEQTKSRFDDSDQLKWAFEVDTGHRQPFTMLYWTALSGRGASSLKQVVQAAYNPKYESGALDTDYLINRPCRVRVEKEAKREGQEKQFVRIVEVLPLQDGGLSFPPDEF